MFDMAGVITVTNVCIYDVLRTKLHSCLVYVDISVCGSGRVILVQLIALVVVILLFILPSVWYRIHSFAGLCIYGHMGPTGVT